MILKIKIIPNSSKNEVIEKKDDFWKIKIKAPATKNKANKELILFLSKELKTAKSLITIKKGLKSKEKIIEIIY